MNGVAGRDEGGCRCHGRRCGNQHHLLRGVCSLSKELMLLLVMLQDLVVCVRLWKRCCWNEVNTVKVLVLMMMRRHHDELMLLLVVLMMRHEHSHLGRRRVLLLRHGWSSRRVLVVVLLM
jgi:hypothetical protein